MADREFDVILFGATGFTGRQAVKYLSLKAPACLKWAIAGRDQTKLEALQVGVPTFVSDASRVPSIDDFVRRTRIVISTAGPFELYSDLVVDACARLRTHYLDITGETLWVRSLIDRYHQMAVENGTRLIPFCGFDSVPADLGAMWIVRQLSTGAREVKAFYQFKGGTPNGGTIATGFRAFASGDRSRLGDLFLLSPETARKPLPVEIDPSHAAYDSDLRSWVAPFIMSAINTRVVRRSCSLLGLDFAYQEYIKSNGPMRAKLFAGLSEAMKKSMELGGGEASDGEGFPKARVGAIGTSNGFGLVPLRTLRSVK